MKVFLDGGNVWGECFCSAELLEFLGVEGQLKELFRVVFEGASIFNGIILREGEGREGRNRPKILR